MVKYKCKACESMNTFVTLQRIREQRQVVCRDCDAVCMLVEYLPQKRIGEFSKENDT